MVNTSSMIKYSRGKKFWLRELREVCWTWISELFHLSLLQIPFQQVCVQDWVLLRKKSKRCWVLQKHIAPGLAAALFLQNYTTKQENLSGTPEMNLAVLPAGPEGADG